MDFFEFIIPSDLTELKTVYAAASYYRPLSGDRPAKHGASGQTLAIGCRQ